MYIPTVSEAVEADIPDPGFEDSKWSGIVKSVDLERQVALIEFQDLLESEKPPIKLTEERGFAQIWPVPTDDSNTDLANRSVGDGVDCWFDDGWWKGVVYIACNDGLLIYFEATPDLSEIKGVTPESMANGKERLRTGVDWDPESQTWTKRPAQVFEGSRDYRAKIQPKKPSAGLNEEGWTDEETDPCQQFHVSDFLEGRVAYPIEQLSSDSRYRTKDEDESANVEKLKLVTNTKTEPLPSQSSDVQNARSAVVPKTERAEMDKPKERADSKVKIGAFNEGGNNSGSTAKGSEHKRRRPSVNGANKTQLTKRKSLKSIGWENLQQRALIKKQSSNVPNKNLPSSQLQEKVSKFVEKFRPAASLDWKTLLEKRTGEGKFAGLCLGPKICVDGLGWAYDETIISRALQEKLVGVRRVDFASAPIFGSARRYSAGYACITFGSIDLAVRGMIELDSYYLNIPGCPIIRPLIAHFPLWLSNPWDMDDVPGQVIQSHVAHFSQMNTIEFDAGIEWLRLKKVHVRAKQELMSSFVKEIEEVCDATLDNKF